MANLKFTIKSIFCQPIFFFPLFSLYEFCNFAFGSKFFFLISQSLCSREEKGINQIMAWREKVIVSSQFSNKNDQYWCQHVSFDERSSMVMGFFSINMSENVEYVLFIFSFIRLIFVFLVILEIFWLLSDLQRFLQCFYMFFL